MAPQSKLGSFRACSRRFLSTMVRTKQWRRRQEPMKALRVLVVEDDAIIGMLLAEMLELMGHEVCALERTEAHAVTAAIRCRPDVMIVDIWLREGSGVAAVERICAASPVPYLFASGDIAGAKAL